MTFATLFSRLICLFAFCVLALATLGLALPSARADIFEWEYINPANPSLGKRESTTLVPGGAGSNAVPGANLRYRNLAKAYLIDKDLTGTNFFGATLIGADLSRSILTGTDFERAILAGAELVGANVRGTNFSNTTSLGFAAAQLYATASYQVRDLTGIGFTYNDLSGWDFVGQNLNNAYFYRATLTDADLTDAEVHSA